MQEMTTAELEQVSGGGTKIGTTGSGDGQQLVGDSVTLAPLGGGIRVGGDPAGKATPILF